MKTLFKKLKANWKERMDGYHREIKEIEYNREQEKQRKKTKKEAVKCGKY